MNFQSPFILIPVHWPREDEPGVKPDMSFSNLVTFEPTHYAIDREAIIGFYPWPKNDKKTVLQTHTGAFLVDMLFGDLYKKLSKPLSTEIQTDCDEEY